MEANSDRHKLVQILSQKDGYVPTNELALRLNAQGEKSEATIRKEIAAINNNAQAMLKLEQFIEGIKASGDKLN